MSTDLLYHGFGIHGYEHVDTIFEGGGVELLIRHKRGSLRCSACGCWNVIRHGEQTRTFRTASIGSKQVRVRVPIPRVECRACGVIRQVRLSFAEPRFSYTRAFERYALELSRGMTIKDVARHLNVSWDTIKEIQKRNLQRRFKTVKLRHLQQIAIDEISIGKGHRYLTIVLDLRSGAVVFTGEGKGADSLRPFKRTCRRRCTCSIISTSSSCLTTS
jgi:transposase